jgi:hypothetical protein
VVVPDGARYSDLERWRKGPAKRSGRNLEKALNRAAEICGVIAVADEVQVMRLGRRVATYKAKETTMEELVGAMTGAVTQENQS